MKIVKKLWYFSFWLYVRLGLDLYYKKIKISGLENIPKGVPIIFGANHENALIDPLIMTTRLPLTIHYLVRADAFKIPAVRWFLNSLNLMPVYRIKDGVNSIQENQRIFKNCYEAFKKGHSLILFPEGTHDMKRVARISKKGISRIAIGAMNEPNAPKELYIVPMGMNYSAHKIFRSTAHVVYGKPIKVEKVPETNENFEILRRKFDEGLKECHVALNPKSFDVMDKVIFHDQNPKAVLEPTEINQLAADVDKKLTAEERQLVNDTTAKLRKIGIHFPLEWRKNFWLNGLFALLIGPVALVGLFLNLLVLAIPWYIMRGIKDKVFIDTIYFGVCLIIPWLWVAITWFIYGWTGDIKLTVVVALFVPTSLVMLGHFNRNWRIFMTNYRLTKNKDVLKVYTQFVDMVSKVKQA